MTSTSEEIKQIVDYFFDNTIYQDNINNPNNIAFKRSILSKGFTLYKRGGLYHEFFFLISKKEEFLNYVICFMKKDYSRLEKSVLKDTFLTDDTMGLLLAAYEYVKDNDVESDFFTYTICGALLIEYYLHDIIYLFRRGNGYSSMPPFNIYDIVRYYLFFKTVKLLDIKYDENRFALEQSNHEGIEFANIIIKLPIIHNKKLSIETAKEVIKSSQFIGLLEPLKMSNNSRPIMNNDQKNSRRQTAALLGSELKTMYRGSFYCSKKHCGNVTNLPILYYLDCIGISDNANYKVEYDGQFCYVFDTVGNEVCDFGHFVIDTVDDDTMKKILNYSIKDSHCKECGALMIMHYAAQGKYQGYLQCPSCNHKEYLILLGYRPYDPTLGKGRYKMSEYFMNLMEDS